MTLWIKVCVSCVPSGVCKSYMYCIVLPCPCAALSVSLLAPLSRARELSAKFIHLLLQ